MTWKSNILLATALYAALWRPAGLAQMAPETILEIRLGNYVNYDYDFLDYTKFATIPSITTPLPMRTFGRHLAIGDIVEVNSRPAMGTCVYFSRMLSLNPNAGAGQAIADVARAMLDDFACEFLQADGTPVGTIMGYGLTHGSPPPGAPRVETAFNYAITGGTGAFLGARGQGGFSGPAPARVASVYEDPANRRILGGMSRRLILHVISMFQPDVVLTASGPAVVHSADFTLVSPAKPAKAGEILSLLATGLGPTKPGVDPGQPFGSNPLHLVNSPVAVTVNGVSAEVLYAGGYPGTTDTYQVNFQLPSGITPGMATIQVSAAWIAGRAWKVAVQ